MSDRIYLDLLKVTEDQDSFVPYINVNFDRLKDAVETYTRNSSANGQVWTAATFLNSWTDFNGATHQTAEFTKSSSGYVYIRGSIASGTLGNAAFTLPVGYRPTVTLTFPTTDANMIEISASGNVTPIGGTNTQVALSGIIFAAEQ